MWPFGEDRSDDFWSDCESSLDRHGKELQVYDCALPSSVYQRCYPISLSRKASLCSIGTLDSADHLSSFYGSGYGLNNYQNIGNNTWGSSVDEDDVLHFSAEKASNNTISISSNRRNSYFGLEDALVSCSLEEECAYGLYDLLVERLEKQLTPLLCSYFGSSSTVLGLNAVLASAVPDILRLSEDEPYGIRGASIILKLRNTDIKRTFKDESLGIIALDQATVSTFELTLVLFEEKSLGVTLKNWFKSAFDRSASKAHIISPHYEIEKKILYR